MAIYTLTGGPKNGVHYTIVGPTDGQEIEFSMMETGSSVFEEASDVPRQKKRMVATTLDALTQKHHRFAECDFLKLDVQGYELEVLKGGSTVLGSAGVVLLEVSLVPVNRGAPSFSDVIRFMRQNGFELFDCCGQIRRLDGVLWQVDLVFLRVGSAFRPETRLTRDNWGTAAERDAAGLV